MNLEASLMQQVQPIGSTRGVATGIRSAIATAATNGVLRAIVRLRKRFDNWCVPSLPLWPASVPQGHNEIPNAIQCLERAKNQAGKPTGTCMITFNHQRALRR
jgi:hypothetical protein